MAGSAPAERLFNPFKLKLLRKRIPFVEAAFGAGFIAILALVMVWAFAQKNNFDPSERDISFATLVQDSVEDTLYRTPFKVWREPGTEGAGAVAVDLGIFPAGSLEGGWLLDGRVETYDPSNVYEKINGAADQYISFGFQRLHYVTLAKEGHFLNLELYDQGDFRNVLGLFVAQRDPSQPVETKGSVFFYPTPAGAIGGVENFYFKIAGSVSGPPVTTKSLDLVERFAGLPVVDGSRPLPYEILTARLDLPIDRIAYTRDNVFQYDFLSDVWFGALADGAEGRYFIHEGDAPDDVGTLFRMLAEEQANEYEVIERDEGRVVMKHGFLGTFFAMVHDGNVILGVEGVDDRDSTDRYLARLRGALRRGEEATDTAS